MFCAGAKEVHFVVYTFKDFKMVVVKRDVSFIFRMVAVKCDDSFISRMVVLLRALDHGRSTPMAHMVSKSSELSLFPYGS